MSCRPLYLCGGLQSSGSTLVSWCFLQRSDMDGVLDARFDTLPQIPSVLACRYAWCKFTIACFRCSEVMQYLKQEGWDPRPLLVTRDVRVVFNSLSTKTYGRNGVTADDPPLRLRLHRFLEDWLLFRERGWPILRYEDLAMRPETVLLDACKGLGLPWDEAMSSWPKPAQNIADARYGNLTFLSTRGGSLAQTVTPRLAAVETSNIPPDDLEWMETHFAEMNRVMGYDNHLDCRAPASPLRAIPRFENTRRWERLERKRRLARSVGRAAEKLAGVFRLHRQQPPAPGRLQDGRVPPQSPSF